MTKFTKVLSVVAIAGAVALGASATADAQGRRGPRGGPRVIVSTSFYNPWFYGGYGYGYGYPYYGYPIGYPFPPYGYYGGYERLGSLRVQVEPREAEVFVDGYYAGVVDDFDGTFQRLRVEPGEHDIQIYLQGYRTLRQKVYVQVDKTFNIKQTLQQLGPGDPPEQRPVAAAPPQEPGNVAGRRDPQQMPPPVRRRGPVQVDRGDGDRGNSDRANGDGGSLSLRVQPADAQIMVDGEPWQASGANDRLVIQVAPGDHRIEIRKPGYVTYVSSVRVRPGDTAPVNVSLTRE